MSQISAFVTITLEKDNVELVEVEFDTLLNIDTLPADEEYLLKATVLGLAAVTTLQHGDNTKKIDMGPLYRKLKEKMDQFFVGQSKNLSDEKSG